MKTIPAKIPAVWTPLLGLIVLLLLPGELIAQGTAFTYQGRLTDNGAPANGNYDLQFAVFDALSSGAQQGATVINNSVGVTNGLFTVTIDPGENVFTGAARWLNIAVRPAGGPTFTNLVPRQLITASPYAVSAGMVTGPINGAQITGGSISSAQLATGAVTAANIASNSITATQLAADAAAANLNASGQSGVASGGMILSSNVSDGNLINAGYVKLGKVDLGDVWEQRASGSPPSVRAFPKAVWTGSEMIVWGGYNGSSYLTDGARYHPTANSWTLMTTNGAPAGRIDCTAVWTGSEMIIWGGHDGSSEVNTGGRYNPVADTWTAVTPTGAPTFRRYHTAVWTGTEMIVWGGYNGNVGVLNSGGRYNPMANSWNAVTTTGAPFTRQNHSAVWTGNEMIIWGGYRGDEVNTGGRYNPASDSWTAVSTASAPVARHAHTAVWTGNEMIIWGGVSGSTNLATGGRYSPLSDSWNSLNTTGAPTPRLEHAAVWTGSEMIIWGGVSNYFGYVYLNDHARYNPLLNTWTKISTNGAPVGRYSHSTIWTGTEMITWGGFYWDGSAHYLNDCGRYSPAANSWTAGAATAAPSRRGMHSAVWTGSEMIVWGGFYYDSFFGSSRFNNGGRYNPAANSWTQITTNGAPIERYDHAAVWTGTEMIIWGGRTGNSGSLLNMNTGGRYDPVNNSWTSVATVGAPSARDYFTTVWTGSEMIIWGGVSNGVYFAGGRYNPLSNSWSAVTALGAPGSRSGHMAVWTGTEMIIWGGYSNTLLVTGGRYNPSADSWSAMTTTGAPSGRTGCTAVWTGSEMIIWGGAGPAESYTNNGARYHPGSNTWTALPSAGSFSARVNHTAVWTGSEMIIWSGYNSTANPSTLNDGLRFNPTANVWTAMTTAGAPAGRGGHSTVWTGSEMIIFGGSDFSSYVGTTFSYRPSRTLYLYQKP